MSSSLPTDPAGLTLEVFLALANLEEAWRVASAGCGAAERAEARRRCADEWRPLVVSRLDALLPELCIALRLAPADVQLEAAALRARLLGPWVQGPRRKPMARLLAGDPIGAATFGMPEETEEESPLDTILREYTNTFRPPDREREQAA